MTHNYPLPTEAELENMITQAYESMSIPEKSRLSLIESKLLKEADKNKPQKNLNKIPWWIVLVLAGSFASAAWWAGEVWFVNENEKQQQEQLNLMNESKTGMNTEKQNKQEQHKENHSYQRRDTPVIYQREDF